MNKEYYGVRRVGDHEEAYIAHAGREKGWKMPNAKYIARLITSNGTYKYIYNQAQLAAAKGGRAMSRVRRTAQNAAGGLRSLEKKYTNKRGALFTQVDNALGLSRSGAQVKKARATRAKVYGTQNGLQKALKNAGSAVSKAAGKAGKALSDASGLTARKELKKAARTAERVSKGISSKRGPYESYNPNDPLEKRRNSTKKRYQDKAVKARDKYNKTLLGRAESAGRSIGDIAEYVGNAAGKAVNSYKARQNSKRIEKKVSKKNAEFKKQQLEKIQKAKEGHKHKSYYEKSREKALDSRRLANRYSYSAGAQHMYARDMQRAKGELNFERRKPKREQYMKNWRKNNLQDSKTSSVQGNEGSRIKPKQGPEKLSEKRKRRQSEANAKSKDRVTGRGVADRAPLHLEGGDRYGLKRPERARWGMSAADRVKYDVNNYTNQFRKKKKKPVLSRRTRDNLSEAKYRRDSRKARA